MAKFSNRASSLYDAATGANALKPLARAKLTVRQIEALAEMTPALSFTVTILSALIVISTFGTQVHNQAIAWAIAGFFAVAYGVSSPANRVKARADAPVENSRDAATGYVIFAAILGMLWMLVPVLFLGADEGRVYTVTVISTVGVLCTGGFIFAAMPAAATAFVIPLMAGVMISGFGIADGMLALILAAAMLTLAGVIILASIRQTQLLVHHLVTEATVDGQRNIISLLLKEFEPNASDWLWEFDQDGNCSNVSARFAKAAGGQSKLEGRDFLSFLKSVSAEGDPIVMEIALDIENRATFNDIVVHLVRSGEEKWWRLTGQPAFDDLGSYCGYVGTASDVTNAKLAEKRINFLAHNDTLTGLLNRAKFTEQLASAVARMERYGSPFAVLYLDLDQFKAVNDSRGHLVGDKLLSAVAARIRGALRDSDIVARLGGDEFAIIAPNAAHADDIALLAARLVEDVSKPYELDGEQVKIGLSVGIAFAPLNGTRPDQILRNADLALYRAKAEGRGNFRFFESKMDSEIRERRVLDLELRQALEDEEFVLYYQPLVSSENGEAGGFEALVRWNHPMRGIVPPAEFIPIAEESGLIQQIGDWTIREACRTAASWPSNMFVAVNLSARHFQSSDIHAVVAAALAESGLAPERLELEITESLLINNPDAVIEKLARLKDLGVTVAMDDFGTGYSSLAYLLKFPFDKIKIDKSFVTASSEDPAARDILRSIASLGKTLRMKVTAEGVETLEQVDYLSGIACHHLQGYYFSRPLDAAAMSAYMLKSAKAKLEAQDEPQRAVA